VLIQGLYEYIELLRAANIVVGDVEYLTIVLAVVAGICALVRACCERDALLENSQVCTAASDSDTDSSDDDDVHYSSSSGAVVEHQPRQNGQYAAVPQLDGSAAMV
jgi:hypothetical protein